MGASDTLPRQDWEAAADLAAAALELDPGDWRLGHVTAHLAAEHPQIRSWPDDNPYAAHDDDHRDWIYDHRHPPPERAAEAAFARLNPHLAGFMRPSDGHGRRRLLRLLEDHETRGWRALTDETAENLPDATSEQRQAAVRRRTLAAHPTRKAADEAFDRLNPDFGILPDDRDPAQHGFAHHREQALALGSRVVLMASRENHPDGQYSAQVIAARSAAARTQSVACAPSRQPERMTPEQAHGAER
jgi:hypothetical protein